MRIEKIGNATLYLGDCMDILPTLEKVDAVITDPPYGIEFKGKLHKFKSKKNGGYISFEDSQENVLLNIIPRFSTALAISKRAVITPGSRMAHSYPAPDAIGGIYNRCGTGSGKWGFECVAPVYYYGSCPYLATGKGRLPNGWEQPVTDFSEKYDHPCAKPIGMMKWLVQRGSLIGETILDPFMGSGTTGVACAQMGRSFIGIEKEPAYFDIACRRIEQAYKQGQLFEHEPIKQIQGDLL